MKIQSRLSKLIYYILFQDYTVIHIKHRNIKRDSRKILNIKLKFPPLNNYDLVSKLFGCLKLVCKHEAWQWEDLQHQIYILKLIVLIWFQSCQQLGCLKLVSKHKAWQWENLDHQTNIFKATQFWFCIETIRTLKPSIQT